MMADDSSREAAPQVARRRIYLSVIVAAGLAAYIGSLSAPFVMDDVSSIERNPNVRSLWPLTEAISAPKVAPVAGRPTTSLTLALNHAISGMAPSGFRAGNLIIHIAAALALFGVVRRTLRTPALVKRFAADSAGIAFASALLWVLHPLNSELMGYLTQRSDALFGLFLLLTLYCSLRADAADSSDVRWQIAAVVACALGMGSKEIMVTAPVIVLLHDQVFSSGTFAIALRRRPGLYPALFATWGLLAWALLTGPDYTGMAMGFGADATPLEYLLTQGQVILHYLRLVVWPYPQILDYGVFQPVTLAEAVLPGGAVAGLVIAAFWIYGSGLKNGDRERQAIGFGGLWFFIILSPTSSIIPIWGEIASERRMYLSLAAPLVFGVVAGSQLLVDSRARSAAVALVALALFGATVARMHDYRTTISLWETVVLRAPHNTRGHLNLANALRDERQLDAAVTAYQESLRVDPENVQSLNNLAAVYLGEGKYELAASYFREALRVEPLISHVSYNLARVLLEQGKWAEAAERLLFELTLEPLHTPSMQDAAWIFAPHPDPAVRNPSEAVRLGQRAVELTAGANLTALDSLAAALASAGRFQEATEMQRRVVVLADRRATRGAPALRVRLDRYEAHRPFVSDPSAGWGGPGR